MPDAIASDARSATHSRDGAARGKQRHEHLKRPEHPKHPRRRRRKHHKQTRHAKHTAHHSAASGLPGAPAPPAIPLQAPPPSSTPAPALSAPITLAQAQRLLWRAGFGPTPGQAEALAGQPLEPVVQSLTRPSGPAVLHGPAPTDDEGNALAPADAWGEDHCWWLDRMVRSDQQLIERMTFIWHDWFANSNEKVNDQQRMLDQNELFRENALGNFQDLFLAVTAEPGDARVPRRHLQRQVGTERELRARDDGAVLAGRRPRRLQRGRRPRNGARADRLDAPNGPKARACRTSASKPSRHDATQQDRVRADGQMELGRRRAAVRDPPAARLVLRREAVELLRPHAALEKPRSPRCRASTSAPEYSIRPSSRRFSQHPDFLNGPELVTPPVVYNAGLLRAIGRPIDTTAWAWLSRRRRPAAVLPAERLRLGLHALAGHLDREGALGNRQLRDREDLPEPVARRRRSASTAKPRNRRQRSPARSATGPTRRSRRNRRTVIAAFAQTCLQGRVDRQVAAQPLPGDAPERPAHADRDVPRHAGQLRWRESCSCNDFTRSQLLRAGVAQAGRGLPTIEPGQPIPAGTGMDRRTFLLRSAGAVLSVYGAAALSPRHFEEGIAQAAASAPRRTSRCSSRSSWKAAGTRCRCWRLSREAKLPRTAPDARAAEGRRRRLHRGRNADVAPAGRRPCASCTAKARSPSSRRSATTRPTRATSRAATTGRSAN